MSEFKALDGGNPFMPPERPFFLLTEDIDENVSYCWWDDEDNMKKDAVERRESGEKIICAIEISSCRNVDICHEYTVDDFIEEINSAYSARKENGFIILSIETDAEQLYYIKETKDGFRCNEFNDFCFDDLDSIAESLFVEKMIGRPVKIRVEYNKI